MAIISGEQYCQSVPDNTNKMSNHLWFYCQCKCVQFTDAITWNQLPDLSIQMGQPPAHTVHKLGGLLPIRCQTVTLYDSIPNWESRSSIGLYLDPTCSGFSQSALAPFFFFFWWTSVRATGGSADAQRAFSASLTVRSAVSTCTKAKCSVSEEWC